MIVLATPRADDGPADPDREVMKAIPPALAKTP